MAAPFEFDRSWHFDMSATALWETLAHTDRYQQWWPWLRRCEVDGDGLVVGAVARCTVRGPLPYSLDFDITLDDITLHDNTLDDVAATDAASGHDVAVHGAVGPVHEYRIDATVTGDLAGTAHLVIVGTEADASTAHLAWTVGLQDRVLGRMALVARPAMVWAHDRVVESGVASFRDHVGVQRT